MHEAAGAKERKNGKVSLKYEQDCVEYRKKGQTSQKGAPVVVSPRQSRYGFEPFVALPLAGHIGAELRYATCNNVGISSKCASDRDVICRHPSCFIAGPDS